MAVGDRTSIHTNSSIESFHSASAIPRPISGTSRKEIPASRFKLSKGIPSFKSEQARRPLRGVSHILESDEGERFPGKNYLPILDIQSPRFDAMFANRETIFHLGHAPELPRRLPESQTSPALLSPGKEIKAHALLRPLDPPLPRSKTCHDVTSLQKLQVLPKHSSPVSIQLSANDKINRKRIEIQRERGKGFSTMFLNTTIPKVHGQHTTPVNERKADEHDDPRYVWGVEPTAYWTGRYMALLDNLRTTELHSAMQTGLSKDYSRKNSSPHVRAAQIFDQNQQNLKKAAIKVLRSFCQTSTALTSFEVFERQLCLRDSDFGDQRKATESLQTRKGNMDRFGSQALPYHEIHSPDQNRNLKPSSHHLGGRISNGLAQNIFRKSSNNLSFPRLTKSCTTSNISNIRYRHDFDHNSPAANERHVDGKLFQLHVSETRIRAIREREARAPSKNFNASTATDRPITTATSLKTPNSIRHQKTSSISLTQSTHGGKSTISSEAGISSIKKGKEPEHDASSEADVLAVETIRKANAASKPECINESTRKFRKSESMRKFFDTSIREVKKISRRVSNNVGGMDDSF